MKQNLYEIQAEHLQLLKIIEEADGELTPEQEKALELNENNRDGKAIAYTEVIGNKEAFNTRIDEEVKRLNAMKKTNNNVIARLKNNLLHAVGIFGSFTVGLVKFGTRKTSSVQVDDVNALPKEYKITKVTEAADKKAIKEALKAGVDVPGCRIIEGTNLKIN